MLPTDLSTLTTFNPVTVEAAETLGELAGMLASMDFHHWPVVDGDGRVVGVLSDTDLDSALQAVAAHTNPAQPDPDTTGPERLARLSVAAIMSQNVAVVAPGEPAVAVLHRMFERRVRSLLVLDRGKLAGLVTTTDFLREFSYGNQTACRLTVSEAMEPADTTIDCDVAIADAADAMDAYESEYVSVVRGDLPLGVISRRDLRMARLREWCAVQLGSDEHVVGERTVLELAAAAPTIRPGERLRCAAGRMVDQHRQAVAVVNQAGRLLGVVTEDGVLKAMLNRTADDRLERTPEKDHQLPRMSTSDSAL